ncbi:hypothetical protein Goe24_02120 [Bacillus phage vB_BsuM-Goe24]|nr:hypothetical protein Goe24_02120 [Bacillus phage vB_BsuM-Goe24]
MEEFKMTVWTNGKAIRKYTGQDKHPDTCPIKRTEWFKATAVIKPETDSKQT